MKNMKTDLTLSSLRELLHYDPETGAFTWRGRSGRGTNKSNAAGNLAGSKSTKGYICIKVGGGKSVKAHRLAWFYMTGEWPAEQIDHKDNIRANNAWANLRMATPKQNAQNQKSPSRNNKSGYLGVTWDRTQEKWAATICVNGRNRRLGRFKDPQSAHFAYLAAKSIHHPFAQVAG